MNAKPVGGSNDPSRKKTDKSSPPPEVFREQLKISEIDPEAQSKWKNMQNKLDDDAIIQRSDTVQSAPSSTSSSSQQGSIYSTPPPSTTDLPPPSTSVNTQTYEGHTIPTSQPTTQTSQSNSYNQPLPLQEQALPLPTSFNFYNQEGNPTRQSTEQQDSSSSGQGQPKEKENEPVLDKKGAFDPKSTKTISKKNSYKKEASSLPKSEPKTKKAEKQALEGAPLEARSEKQQTTFQPATKKNEDGVAKSPERQRNKQVPIPIKKETADANVSYKKDNRSTQIPKKKDKKEDGTKEEKKPVQAHLLSLTPDVENTAYQATKSLSSYIDPKVETLFQNMVGAVIQTTKKGVSKTEFLLNQPNLKNSQFYGSKITLTKYSSSPSSYNIFLSTPSAKALTQFTNGLASLKTAFIQGNFDFKVGRLEAHYKSDRKEGFLFRRKENSKEKDMGSSRDEE